MPKLNKYSIVIGKNASYNELASAKFLANNISAATGYQIPVYKDDMPEKEYEIVVGETNREQSAGVALERSEERDYDYVIRYVGTKLFLSGYGKVGEKIILPYNSYLSLNDGAIGTTFACCRFISQAIGDGYLYMSDFSKMIDVDAEDIEIDARYDYSMTKADLYAEKPAKVEGAVMYSIPVLGTHRRFGSCAIFKASDGSLAVYNGGLEADAEHLLEMLESLSNGKKPHVSAWLISLPMFGYNGALKAICENEELTKRVDVDKVYYKVLSENFHIKGSATSRVEYADYRAAVLNTANVFSCEMCEVKTGDIIKMGDIEFEVLYAPTEETESIQRVHYNEANVVYMAKVGTKKVLLAGASKQCFAEMVRDNDAEKFACDLLVLPNHGKDGLTKECYEKIGAEKYLYQTCPALYYGDNGEGVLSNGDSVTRTRIWLSELGVKSDDMYNDMYGIFTYGAN